MLTIFGQNPSTGLEIMYGNKKADTYADADVNAEGDGIDTKTNISPTLWNWGTE